MYGDSPQEMYNAITSACNGRSNDFDRCWGKLPGMMRQPPEIALGAEGVGESWEAEEAATSALYYYCRSPSDFREIVLCAANTEGDSDSIACIAGGIAGVALRVDAILGEWLEVLQNAEMLQDVGKQLFVAAISNGELLS